MPYHALAGFAECAPGELRVARARAIALAVAEHTEAHLVATLKAVGALNTAEAVIVELECPGVPPRNPASIQYRERVALLVDADERVTPRALALRQDFPVLLHQIQRPSSAPAELCIYFGPTEATLRTWTAASYLRRIQWWMEASARGELHTNDQPVENLFYATHFELVLPSDFTTWPEEAVQRAVLELVPERPGGGQTLVVKPITGETPVEGIAATCHTLRPPPMLHGLARSPETLGDLADRFLALGYDLRAALVANLRAHIPSHGIPVEESKALSVLMLQIPIYRNSPSDIERLELKAFVLYVGRGALGLALGAYIQHGQTYFTAAGILGDQGNSDWRGLPVDMAEVLMMNSPERARLQSGIASAGPPGTLVGAGALGSALLGIWGRSGWGVWSVIDNDHIRPHNLSRHTAHVQHIGFMKAKVAASLHASVTARATPVNPIVGDASEFSDEFLSAATGSEIVVDASTALGYPRAASLRDDLPRHMSAFLTPSGQGAVLLAEDSARTVRLLSLEAQYYRSLIQEPWGAHHLQGHLGQFWSGAGCRDVSAVIPYSAVLAHASTLSEQVRQVADSPEARILIWTRDTQTGTVSRHEVAVRLPRSFVLADRTALADEGLIERLRAMRERALPSETGGILIGFYDLPLGLLVLVDALPAPKDSREDETEFVRGTDGMLDAVRSAGARTAGIVQYVGEWHSHPPGAGSRPSGRDLVQLKQLSEQMRNDGLPAIQVIVGERDFSVGYMSELR